MFPRVHENKEGLDAGKQRQKRLLSLVNIRNFGINSHLHVLCTVKGMNRIAGSEMRKASFASRSRLFVFVWTLRKGVLLVRLILNKFW